MLKRRLRGAVIGLCSRAAFLIGGLAARVVATSASLLVVGLLQPVHAQPAPIARTIYTDVKTLWRLTTWSNDYFDDRDAGFSGYADYLTSASTSCVISKAFNLHPSTPTTTVNGIPTNWYWDWTVDYVCSNPPDHQGGTTGSEFLTTQCPDQMQPVTEQLDSTTYRSYCKLTDTSWKPSPNTCPVGNPIYPGAGVKVQPEVDYDPPSSLLKFTRTYRSDSKVFASFLNSTFLDFSGAGSQLGQCIRGWYWRGNNEFGYPIMASYCFPVISLGLPSAFLRLPSGKEIAFDLSTGAARADSNVTEKAVKFTDSQGQTVWRVWQPDNSIADYSATTTRLTQLVRANGQRVQYSYSDASTPPQVAPASGFLIAASDSFGRSLQFRYDGNGLLTQLIDPDQKVYSYVSNSAGVGCLGEACTQIGSVTFPDGFTKTYSWDEPGLSASSSRGFLTGLSEVWPAAGGLSGQTIRVGSYQYDSGGMAVATERAGGTDRYSISGYGSSVTVTDPLNTSRGATFQFIFNTAYPASYSQPAGSGCNASSKQISYDANANMEKLDDFNGDRVCYGNDLTRNLRTLQVEGLSTGDDCPSLLTANAAIPAGSRKTSTTWHPDWRLETKRAEALKRTTWVYNGQPDPFNGNTVASCAPSTALLPDGKPIAVLCKQVEQATTDADGHLGFAAALQSGVPDRARQWTYNQYGQVLSEKGPRTDVDETTNYVYYATTAADYTMGDLKQVTDPANRVTQYPKYNKHGQVLRMVDPNGVITDNTYDLRLRLLSGKRATEALLTTSASTLSRLGW